MEPDAPGRNTLPLLADKPRAAVEAAQAALQAYAGRYERYWLDGMRAKTGLQTHDDDKALIEDLLGFMAANRRTSR